MNRLNTNDLRKAFGSFMTGVTVVTARSSQGELIGFTANSFTSVSMDPPLLLVCPGNHLSSFDEFNKIEHFAVSILAEGQESVSTLFASATDDRFSQVEYTVDAFGSPLIKGAVAHFSCSTHQRQIAGDHLILIGKVEDFKHVNQKGLGYCTEGYFSLSKEQHSSTPPDTDSPSMVGAIIQIGNSVVVSENQSKIAMPSIPQDTNLGARESLKRHFKSLGLDASLGTVYSIYNDTEKNAQFTFIRVHLHSQDIASLGVLKPISAIENLIEDDQAQSSMMSRYAAESHLNTFGLYVGNSVQGDVHKLIEDQE